MESKAYHVNEAYFKINSLHCDESKANSFFEGDCSWSLDSAKSRLFNKEVCFYKDLCRKYNGVGSLYPIRAESKNVGCANERGASDAGPEERRRRCRGRGTKQQRREKEE